MEEARAADARVGRAEAAYYPTLSFMAAGGTSRVADQAPSLGTFTVEGLGVNPRLQLNWILLDFGRRSGSVERRGQELFEANFAFNRKLQEVAFSVSRNYFSLDASRARVTAARATLESAVATGFNVSPLGSPRIVDPTRSPVTTAPASSRTYSTKAAFPVPRLQ